MAGLFLLNCVSARRVDLEFPVVVTPDEEHCSKLVLRLYIEIILTLTMFPNQRAIVFFAVTIVAMNHEGSE